METKSACGFTYLISGNTEPGSPCIYYLGLPQELDETELLIKNLNVTVVFIQITMDDWDNLLTPWPAPGLYRNDPDFKGQAPEFLKTLLDGLIPTIEADNNITPDERSIAGYSLAGLFATYAFANCDTFRCLASMSGSFWYGDWPSYITSLKLNKRGCEAFISLGDKERKAKEKVLHSVQDNTDTTIKALESWGVNVTHHLVPGGHFDNIYDRVAEGLTALAHMSVHR